MSLTRSELREKIMIILYQYDLMNSNKLNCNIEDIIKDNLDVENDFVKDILRLALYELKYTDTPEVVVINEAIELAKKYSDDAVRKMINAVLDKYIKE